jgi:hypothetical protein
MKAYIISHDEDRQLIYENRWETLGYQLVNVSATTPATYEDAKGQWNGVVEHDRFHSHLIGGKSLLLGEQCLRLSFMTALRTAIDAGMFPCIIVEADCIPFVHADDLPCDAIVEIMRPYHTLKRARVDKDAPIRQVAVKDLTDLHPNPASCDYFWGSHATVVKDAKAGEKLMTFVAQVAMPTDIVIWYKALTGELHVLRCLQELFIQSMHKSTIR